MSLVGQKVKLFLINSLSAEGIVHIWNDLKVVLISNQKQLVVNNPNNNIIMYYVFDSNLSCDIPAAEKEESKDQLAPAPSPVPESDSSFDSNLKNQEQNLKELNTSLKLKKIADLKIMAAKAQRDQIKKQLTTFHSINTDQILGKYGTPSFINPQYSSSQEANDGNAIDPGIMSEMPRKATE
jgi:hypothetical protein